MAIPGEVRGHTRGFLVAVGGEFLLAVDRISEEVAPDASAWLSGIETASETWRDSEHSRTWNWGQAG